VHVKVLARLFRGKFLVMLIDAHSGGQLKFFNTHAGLEGMAPSQTGFPPRLFRNPARGTISHASPLARSLIGKCVGDVAKLVRGISYAHGDRR
jgi:hypothetical protein